MSSRGRATKGPQHAHKGKGGPAAAQPTTASSSSAGPTPAAQLDSPPPSAPAATETAVMASSPPAVASAGPVAMRRKGFGAMCNVGMVVWVGCLLAGLLVAPAAIADPSGGGRGGAGLGGIVGRGGAGAGEIGTGIVGMGGFVWGTLVGVLLWAWAIARICLSLKISFSRVVLSGIVWLCLGWFLFHATAIIFGAPVFYHFEQTMQWSMIMALFCLVPAGIFMSDHTYVWLLHNEKAAYARIFLVPATLCSLFGAWIGAFVIPLDWDRPWQVWPTPCTYEMGALVSPDAPPTSPHLDVVIDAKSQFVALAFAASPVNSIENRNDVTTALRRFRSRNNIRAGRCDAHVIAVVGSLMRHIGENHVVRPHRHMVMSLDATPSDADAGHSGREVRLHVWIDLSPTLGVVHSQVVVTPPQLWLLSPIDVCCDGGKEERWFVFNDYRWPTTEDVLRVMDHCGKAHGVLARLSAINDRYITFLVCNTKWLVIGFYTHMKILRINSNRWVVPKSCDNGEEISDEDAMILSDTNPGFVPVSVPFSGSLWYRHVSFLADSEDQILMLAGGVRTVYSDFAHLVDLNASFETMSLSVISTHRLPSGLANVECAGEVLVARPEVIPGIFRVYDAKTEEFIHTFPKGSTVVLAGPDCVCETHETTTGTYDILHIKSLGKPLYSLPSTTTVHTDQLSGVLATTETAQHHRRVTTEATATTPPPVLTVKFQDAITGSVIAVLRAPNMRAWSPYEGGKVQSYPAHNCVKVPNQLDDQLAHAHNDHEKSRLSDNIQQPLFADNQYVARPKGKGTVTSAASNSRQGRCCFVGLLPNWVVAELIGRRWVCAVERAALSTFTDRPGEFLGWIRPDKVVQYWADWLDKEINSIVVACPRGGNKQKLARTPGIDGRSKPMVVCNRLWIVLLAMTNSEPMFAVWKVLDSGIAEQSVKWMNPSKKPRLNRPSDSDTNKQYHLTNQPTPCITLQHRPGTQAVVAGCGLIATSTVGYVDATPKDLSRLRGHTYHTSLFSSL
ncbi:GPI ethanolamine phosphate transferase 2/3 subunit F [Pelomyxa schiedti]|nr:GPI ethanolamine phosphate transferase 2/3 subunit F [Pelomyxa schiedti]